jgi:type IV pilus assembly protein PilQ
MASSVSQAQVTSAAPAPLSTSLETVSAAPTTPAAVRTTGTAITDGTSMTVVQATTSTVAPVTGTASTTAGLPTDDPTSTALANEPVGDTGGVGVREFQGDEVGQVLRLLARQAKINMVVSDQIPPTMTVTMRLDNVTAMRAIDIIATAKGLILEQKGDVYYIKTPAERLADPTESASYQLSYARAKDIAVLVASQLQSKEPPQVDERTNTIFYRETEANMPMVKKLLEQIDRPTKQVMIEARLVEVNANPRQSYGINWAGVVGSATSPQTVKFGGSSAATFVPPVTNQQTGVTTPGYNLPAQPTLENGRFTGSDFVGRVAGGALSAAAGQFAILSAPSLSLTLQALNEDADTEFLANPRVVTADNMEAKIEITRNQPVPKLNFNEQTATAVFGGFEDKKFGNTLVVKPLVNKDSFITLSVKPEISNKVFDQPFTFAGATVTSPVIDTRSLQSNVLIKSGDTLAIGGLMQDEVSKARTKVPVLGDVPVLGYLFQSRTNARTKRNLLVFVTPTIIDQQYGTGLEDQVSGVRHSGEEFADPNGWRNNAKGAVRLVPTSHRQIAADYPKPGIPPAPARTKSNSRVRFMADAKDREY